MLVNAERISTVENYGRSQQTSVNNALQMRRVTENDNR